MTSDPTGAPVDQPALTDEEREALTEHVAGRLEDPEGRDVDTEATDLIWVVASILSARLAARDADLRERLADPALVEAVLREHAWGDDTAQVGHHAVYCACGWKDYEASGDIYALRARHDQHRATVVAAALSGEAGR